jgi:hypothetical protein
MAAGSPRAINLAAKAGGVLAKDIEESMAAIMRLQNQCKKEPASERPLAQWRSSGKTMTSCKIMKTPPIG